jgi:repressor LexA
MVGKANSTLTKRQQKVLGFIKKFMAKKGYSPTFSELSAGLKIGNTAALGHVKALEKKGAITRAPKLSRSIVVVE